MTEQSEITIAVLGAMQPEVSGLVAIMTVEDTGATAGFQYWTGRLAGRRVVVARCGMGKVAAAAGVQRLIDGWQVSCVVVCGLAGGLADGVGLGDIVIGESFVQYDLDASPIYPRFEVPGLGITRFAAHPGLAAAAESAAQETVASLAASMPRPSSPGNEGLAVHCGLIATGDQFVKDERRAAVLRDFPEALCVEMEGGAIAQVCHLNEVPFVVVRVVSDTADADAPVDFRRFVSELAPRYTVSIVRRLLAALPGRL